MKVVAVIPGRASGVLVAPFGDQTAIYDTASREVTIMTPITGFVLDSADRHIETVVRDLVDATGALAATVQHGVLATIGELENLGFFAPDNPADGAVNPYESGGHPRPDAMLVREGATITNPLPLFDEQLVFRSTSRELLASIEKWLGLAASDVRPTRVFNVEPSPAGGVHLEAAEVWDFPTMASFRVQLPGVINDFASRTSAHLVLHSGGVRNADGHVTLLPGTPEAGKSTLTAALVAAGADYLGDELIGIRPDTCEAIGFPRHPVLEPTSRDVLGIAAAEPTQIHVPIAMLRVDAVSLAGNAGTVGRIVVPCYDPTVTTPIVTRLSPRDALEALLPSAMNLELCGEPAWGSLCELAAYVPVYHARYPDAVAFAGDFDRFCPIGP